MLLRVSQIVACLYGPFRKRKISLLAGVTDPITKDVVLLLHNGYAGKEDDAQQQGLRATIELPIPPKEGVLFRTQTPQE